MTILERTEAGKRPTDRADGTEEAFPSGAPLLTAKFHAPPIPAGAVSRPGLLDLLRSGRGRRLTMVCAPAGYGKTTTLAQWRAVDGARSAFAWVSLDRSDSDPVSFWRYAIAALAGCEPSVGSTSLPCLQSSGDGGRAETVARLVEELEAGEGDVTLVLDDYHLAQSVPVNESVASFIRFRPPRVQVVIACRSDPALPLGHLRASQELVELRADRLRFDEAEAAAFFEGASVQDLSESEVRRLVGRTEGWPATLRLAALLLEHSEDRREGIQALTGGNPHVIDYITTDVFDTLPVRTRSFLLETSILDRLGAPLCDAVTDRRDSAAILAQLDHTNAFVVALDGSQRWYRYHPLFAQTLRLELERRRPGLVPKLHRRASVWFEEEGDVRSATEHAVRAHDAERAGCLLIRQIPSIVATGPEPTLERWLESLSWPDAVANPELAIVRALVAGMHARLSEAERWLEAAGCEGSSRGVPDLPFGFLASWLRAFFGVHDVSAAHGAALVAVAEAPSSMWEGAALAELGQALYLQGRDDHAGRVLRLALALIPNTYPLLLCQAAGYLAFVECGTGDVDHAERVVDGVLALLGSGRMWRAPLTGVAHMGRGAVLTARGRLTEARSELEMAAALRHDASPNAWYGHALLALAGVRYASGLREDAVEALAEAEATLDRLPDPGRLVRLETELRQRLEGPPKRRVSFGQDLSDREVAVLRLLAIGLTHAEVAAQLFVSRNTVKSHVRSIYRKLGATSRCEAVASAVGLGVLGTTLGTELHHPGEPATR